MARHITKHADVLAAITRTEIISELVEFHNGHYTHELDLEVIVYGRNYAGKKVGPYARLLECEPGEIIVTQGDASGNTFYILTDGTLDVHVRDDDPPDLIGNKVASLEAGTSFGEMAILAGVPRNASVVTPPETPATVLELTRPALRLLRNLPKFRERLDATYRSHGLGRTLEDVRQLTDDTDYSFDKKLLAELRAAARFMVYGKNHVLVHEGANIESVLLIKNGWVRRVRGAPLDTSAANIVAGLSDDARVDFLGAGNCLGLESLDNTAARRWNYTATILARTEVLEISLAEIRANPRLRERLRQAFATFSIADDDTELVNEIDQRALVATEREITTGVVDGTNLLVMDMDKCVRCGNCSFACHQMHGQSRLLRRGIHIERPARITQHTPRTSANTNGNPSGDSRNNTNGNSHHATSFEMMSVLASGGTQHILSPSVCMHCQDPECLTGCPTGAIGWKPSGEIDITNETCIGCGDCATQCPYNAISMVPRASKREAKPIPAANGEAKSPTAFDVFANRTKGYFDRYFNVAPTPLPASVTETENLLAVKCNLCHDTPLNPANRKQDAYSCQENCPTGALVRVNPRLYFDEVGRTLGLKFQDATHAVGRDIHKRDSTAQMWHLFGTLGTIVLTLATVFGLLRFGFDTPLVNANIDGTTNTVALGWFSWLTMRWLTGIVGLLGIAAVMTYPFRKKVYRRRAGALRYWMLAHIYVGAIAGIILLLHGGTRTGGLLTTLLMLAFDLVILSGLFGLAVYLIAPRIMTSIEGEPLLIEDLQARRAELRENLAAVVARTSADVRATIASPLQRRFFTARYLLRHYIKREELSAMLASAREEYEAEREKLKTTQERADLTEAIEIAVTLRRADALIYLHGLLKIWVAPHVVSTSAMLALLVVHIIQVVFFRVH